MTTIYIHKFDFWPSCVIFPSSRQYQVTMTEPTSTPVNMLPFTPAQLAWLQGTFASNGTPASGAGPTPTTQEPTPSSAPVLPGSGETRLHSFLCEHIISFSATASYPAGYLGYNSFKQAAQHAGVHLTANPRQCAMCTGTKFTCTVYNIQRGGDVISEAYCTPIV